MVSGLTTLHWIIRGLAHLWRLIILPSSPQLSVVLCLSIGHHKISPSTLPWKLILPSHLAHTAISRRDYFTADFLVFWLIYSLSAPPSTYSLSQSCRAVMQVSDGVVLSIICYFCIVSSCGFSGMVSICCTEVFLMGWGKLHLLRIGGTFTKRAQEQKDWNQTRGLTAHSLQVC